MLRYPCPIEGDVNWEHFEKSEYSELGEKVSLIPNCLKPDLTQEQRNNFKFMRQRYLFEEKEMHRLVHDKMTSDDLAREMKIFYNFVPTDEIMGMLTKRMIQLSDPKADIDL